VMAKVQHDQRLLKSVYLNTMRMTASVSFPIYLALAAFSEDVVLLLLGAKWLDSAPLLSILAVWGLIRSTGNPVGSLLLAVGKADLSLKWNLVLLLVVPLSLWTAAHWGILGLATGQAILMAVLIVPGWYFLVRPNCGAAALEYARTLLGPLFCALPTIGLAYIVVFYVQTPLYRLLVAASVAVPTYLLLSFFFNREWLGAMRQLLNR